MRNWVPRPAVTTPMLRKILLPALALGACQTQTENAGNLPANEQPAAEQPASNAPADSPDQPVSSDDPAPAPDSGASSPPPSSPSGCAAIDSSGWSAWVNAMPGPNARPRLIATGKVTVPTGGYRWQWTDMRVAESYPVQVTAELRLIPPSGGATQAISTLSIRGEWPIDPPVGSFTVRCGSRVLARISPVESAH